ncbi:MAG: LPS export ABC transporter permease LptF [Acidobacteriota bacterium]|nr:LPS export ABC transporter permease LptF [Acidobacteriota bacterium]
MRTLDRYIIREIIPPFVIALLVFTFILIIPFILDLAETMIAKGVPWTTILRLILMLVPMSLALTIPMALLIGILVAFGRLSSDREVVVMMACGLSPYRLLRPVLVFAVVCWALDSWVLLKAMPDGNQASREITQEIAMDRAEGEVRPRVFFEDFPGVVLYVRQVPVSGGGWEDVLAADTSNPSQPIIFLAKRGRMVVDRQAKTIQMVLEEGTRHTTKLDDPNSYQILRFDSTIVSLNPESVFPTIAPPRGERELGVPELKARIAELRAAGLPPHNTIMELHKKFSIPIACFVFAVLGVALGASHRKDGKMASFVLGTGVIFVYYVIMFTAIALTKGGWMPAWLSMWLPNIFLGAAGLVLLVTRSRSADQPIAIWWPSWWARKTAAATAAEANTGLPASPGRRPILVLRIPQFELPRPNLLDIYVGKQYLRILGMTIVGLLGLFYISTFIDLSDKLFKGQTTVSQLLAFLAWSTPQFLAYVIAIAVLLSALVTIGLLTKNSELIVMRACGISLYRTMLPLVAFAAGASVILFAMEERLLATSNGRAERLRHIIRTGSPQTFDLLNRKWLVGRNGEVYHYQYYDQRGRDLNGLSVFKYDAATHTVTHRLFAQRADYVPNPDGTSINWTLQQGWSREFGGKADIKTFERFTTKTVPLEPPDYFVTEAPEPDRMTYQQLRGYITELRASGYDVLENEVGLHRKIAFPFVTLVMTLIAVPFAVTTGRRGAMYGIGIGIVLALVYWTMISVFAAFGAAGSINPMLAAWAPNLVFGAAAACLLLTVRT